MCYLQLSCRTLLRQYTNMSSLSLTFGNGTETTMSNRPGLVRALQHEKIGNSVRKATSIDCCVFYVSGNLLKGLNCQKFFFKPCVLEKIKNLQTTSFVEEYITYTYTRSLDYIYIISHIASALLGRDLIKSTVIDAKK